MTQPKLPVRRSRRDSLEQVPGFAPAQTPEPEESAGADPSVELTPAADVPGEQEQTPAADGGPGPEQEPASPAAAQASERTREPGRRRKPAGHSTRADLSDWENAGKSAYHTHLLDPGRAILEGYVQTLKDRGMKTDMTEILHALILDAADDPDALVVRIKALRRARQGL